MTSGPALYREYCSILLRKASVHTESDRAVISAVSKYSPESDSRDKRRKRRLVFMFSHDTVCILKHRGDQTSGVPLFIIMCIRSPPPPFPASTKHVCRQRFMPLNSIPPASRVMCMPVLVPCASAQYGGGRSIPRRCRYNCFFCCRRYSSDSHVGDTDGGLSIAFAKQANECLKKAARYLEMG